MIILAIDTALEICSAALLDGERVLAARSEAMARVRIPFPGPGEWTVTLFAVETAPVETNTKKKPIEVPTASFVGRLGFTTTEGIGPTELVPQTYVGWHPGFELLSPLLWTAGTPVTVAVRLPGVTNALVFSGSERWPMTRDGEIFTVDIPGRPTFQVGTDGAGILSYGAGSP